MTPWTAACQAFLSFTNSQSCNHVIIIHYLSNIPKYILSWMFFSLLGIYNCLFSSWSSFLVTLLRNLYAGQEVTVIWSRSKSCPLSWWCRPTISSSVAPFSSCLQSFPASGSFPMSLFFTSGGQSIRVSASASVLPMNIQAWFPLGWTGWISLQSKGLSRGFSNTTIQSINSSVPSFLYSPTLTSIHGYWENHSFD